MDTTLVAIAGVITALAGLVGSVKVVEAIIKARQSQAKGEVENEIAANVNMMTSWQQAQQVQNQNIIDIWTELKWLRSERELDIEYIDELHSHIDELRDIALTNGHSVPPTPRRRKRTPPPLTSRNPADVAAELQAFIEPPQTIS